MTDAATTLIGIIKTHGILVGFIIALIWSFFYKYIPAQAKLINDLVESHNQRVDLLISQSKQQVSDIMTNFRAEIAAKTEQSKTMFDTLSLQHKSMMEEMTKNNERMSKHTDEMMKLIQDNYQKLLDRAALIMGKQV